MTTILLRHQQRILDQLSSGVLILDRQHRICDWNSFWDHHVPFAMESTRGQLVYQAFPELPRRWFERKIDSVLALQAPAFSSWQQRPHLFHLPHNRPITTSSRYMMQNCTLTPLTEENGEVAHVCVIVEDATDVAFYQQQLHQTLAQLEKANRTDGLTGAANRRYWEESLHREFLRARRYQQPLSLLMLDLDHFKRINDNFGHKMGDTVLISVVNCIRPLLRDNDLLGRYGGEEFGLLLPQTTLEGALEVAERLRKAVEALRFAAQPELRVSLSIGVQTLSGQHQQPEQLVNQADMALYQAKRQGRNQVCCYHPEMMTFSSPL